MLKFGQNSVAWGDISHFNAIEEDACEVSLTTTDSVTLVIATFDNAADAQTLKTCLEAAKAVSGGVIIIIDIDDCKTVNRPTRGCGACR